MVSKPTEIVYEGPYSGFIDRVFWLSQNYGDRDPMLQRWNHHSNKGNIRKYWDYKRGTPSSKDHVVFKFGTCDMATLFKLTWGN